MKVPSVGEKLIRLEDKHRFEVVAPKLGCVIVRHIIGVNKSGSPIFGKYNTLISYQDLETKYSTMKGWPEQE